MSAFGQAKRRATVHQTRQHGSILRLTLSPNSNADRWGSPLGRHGALSSWYLAAGVAVLTHAIVLGIVARLVPKPAPPAAEPAGIPLVLQSVQPLATASLSPAAGAVPRLAPLAGLTIETGHVAAPATIRHYAAPVNRAPAGRPVSGSRQSARSTAPPAASAPAQEARASAPSMAGTGAPKQGEDGAALLPALEARIDESVRQAAAMPEAARRQHRQGRARVKFTYIDGRVDDVELVAGSQSRVLDDAALQAVSRAAYPPPPEALRGRHLDLLVWVNFRLDA